MNPNEPARNGITRRNFMKKTALTAGAALILSRGTGLASFFGCSAKCAGITAKSPQYFYSYVNDGGEVKYFELGTHKCAAGHDLGGQFMMNEMTQAQMDQAFFWGYGYGAWGEGKPLPARHAGGDCNAGC